MAGGTAPTIRAPRRPAAALWRRWLWLLPVLVRLVVAGVLAVGPATDEPSELAGWDADRFQEIVDRDGRAWADEPVEYPPGTVVLLDLLAGPDVVATHRRLVALSVVVDLSMAAALWRRVGAGAARTFLWLGLPLVPLGYQRLDTVVTAMALVGGLALLSGARGADRRTWGPGRRRPPAELTAGLRARLTADGRLADAAAAVAVAAATLTKVWPGVLVVAALAAGRWRAAAGAVVLGGLGAGVWLVAVGAGLDPVDQVLSLRGAGGWHVESLPGALVALLTDDPARLELDAFRIGTLRPTVVSLGRLLALAVMAALVLTARGRLGGAPPPVVTGAEARRKVALVTLGAIAALLVTAPLLSPQFLVWTTPWAALLAADGQDRGSDLAPAAAIPGPGSGPAVALTATVAILTGVTLTTFGPDGLSATVPALLLTVRNLGLVALTAACLSALGLRGQEETLGNAPGKARGGTVAPAHTLVVRIRRSTRWPR